MVGAAVAGGVLAATLVGLGEAGLIAFERGLGFDGGLLFFALLFYGGAGLAAGVGAGIGLGMLAAITGVRLAGAPAFAISGATIFAALATIIGRFRVFRDVFHESFEGQALSPMAFQLASLGVAIVLIVVGFFALRAVARQQPWLASPVAMIGLLVLGIGGSWAAMTAAGDRGATIRPVSGSAPTGPSVILLMVDTLRADHLSCYGYGKSATPAIDRLAADGTRFGRAYAQASWTRPSVATILTSLYPSSHQAVHKSDVLPDDVVTLPEVMQAAGYRTVGFPNNINVAPLFNFQQGFDEYHFLEPAFFFGATEEAAQLTVYNQLRVLRERYLSDVKHVENYYQPAEVVNERALSWIEANGERPFFMFLHYMEPHDPYFNHPYDGQGFARVANPNPDGSVADTYRAAYDGEIRHLDEQIGALLEALRSRGIYDRTMIVLTADHGEEFHEHGGWWHGLTLYEEQIAVPLLVKPVAGDAVAGAVNNALVSSLDVAPTILQGAGIQVPETMQGGPLTLAAGTMGPRDHVFSEQDLEGNRIRAYRKGELKLIEANASNPRGLPEQALFELTDDADEQQDLLASRAADAQTLSDDLGAVEAHAVASAVEAAETAIDGATRERLRALGYVAE